LGRLGLVVSFFSGVSHHWAGSWTGNLSPVGRLWLLFVACVELPVWSCGVYQHRLETSPPPPRQEGFSHWFAVRTKSLEV